MFDSVFFHYALPVLMYAKEVYENIAYECTYYFNTIVKSLTSNELIFFEGNPNAYLSSYVKTGHTYSGLVVWRYNIYYNTFYSYECAFKDTKHFPILSMSLECESTKINLDDFIEELKVHASNPGFPTLQQVMEVYTYTSGIVFDRTKPWKLNILDTNVNDYTLDIFNDSWPFTETSKN